MRWTAVDILISDFWEVSNEIKAPPHLPYCHRWPQNVILGRGPPYQPLSTCKWSASIPSRWQAMTLARTSTFSPLERAYLTTDRDAAAPTHVLNTYTRAYQPSLIEMPCSCGNGHGSTPPLSSASVSWLCHGYVWLCCVSVQNLRIPT
jgi:hypothetical protein